MGKSDLVFNDLNKALAAYEKKHGINAGADSKAITDTGPEAKPASAPALSTVSGPTSTVIEAARKQLKSTELSPEESAELLEKKQAISDDSSHTITSTGVNNGGLSLGLETYRDLLKHNRVEGESVTEWLKRFGGKGSPSDRRSFEFKNSIQRMPNSEELRLFFNSWQNPKQESITAHPAQTAAAEGGTWELPPQRDPRMWEDLPMEPDLHRKQFIQIKDPLRAAEIRKLLDALAAADEPAMRSILEDRARLENPELLTGQASKDAPPGEKTLLSFFTAASGSLLQFLNDFKIKPLRKLDLKNLRLKNPTPLEQLEPIAEPTTPTPQTHSLLSSYRNDPDLYMRRLKLTDPKPPTQGTTPPSHTDGAPEKKT